MNQAKVTTRLPAIKMILEQRDYALLQGENKESFAIQAKRMKEILTPNLSVKTENSSDTEKRRIKRLQSETTTYDKMAKPAFLCKENLDKLDAEL